MMIDRIRQAVRNEPFRPFNVRLADGSVHTVTHREFIAIPPGRRPRDLIFFVERPRGEYETHWINAMLVLDVTVPGEMDVAVPAGEEEQD
jgi:hypothetical protein